MAESSHWPRDWHIYSRNTNPTVRAFEAKVKTLGNAQAANSFALGMAVISSTLTNFAEPSDCIVPIKDSFGDTKVIFNEFLPPLGIDVALFEAGVYRHLKTKTAKGYCLGAWC
jgi:cystathionine gamma-synthase